MALIFLEPGDLAAAEAARVLDFLNRAASAAEIAAGIEIPGEPDIGLKLGQRLLNARAALGGRFSDLRQVDAVPLIGPERFTDLCAAILGWSSRQWRIERDPPAESHAALLARLAAFEERTVQVVLDLGASPRPAWLGQRLDLTLRAVDAAGLPLANRRVTLEASLGTLSAAYGFAVQRGRALSLRTGADGGVRLRLNFDTLEPLSADQQAALENALAGLDAAADSPHLLRQGFYALAGAYQGEREKSLRAALDIYARQWKGHFLDQLNASNLGFEWPLETCVLRADCHPEGGGAGSVAQAVLAVHWKNWVGAWLEFLGQWLRDKAGFDQAFGAAKARAEGNYHLVDNLVGEAHSFIAGLKGEAAEWLSQRQVKVAVNDFLGRELSDLDDQTQRELFAYLEGASQQLTAAGRGTLAMVNQTRRDLDAKIVDVGGVNAGMLEEVRGLRDAMLGKAAEIEQRLADFDGRYQTFSDQYAGFQRNYQTFSQNYSTFSGNYGDFNNRYAQASVDLSAFQRDYAGFTSQYSQFTSNYDRFETDSVKLTREIGAVKTDIGGLKTNVADLNRRVGSG